MKGRPLFLMILGCVLLLNGMPASGETTADLFPSIEGWRQKGDVASYSPDTLFEYINGAADVFLSYDFVQCLTATLENSEKHTITIDIYRHGDDKNGFGIYSQEKPSSGSFLPIGTQGYYEKGVLNFYKGSHYVKISGFDVGEREFELFKSLAERIAAKIPGRGFLPVVLTCFPAAGKKENTERFISQNFLGHRFLGSAYIADYQLGEKDVQLFIIQGDNPESTANMEAAYLGFAEKKGASVQKKNGIIRFTDPYYKRNGAMNFKRSGGLMWGLFLEDEKLACDMIGMIEKNLKDNRLLNP